MAGTSAGNRRRGGRTIASNGYVLVFVGHAHHLADVRGYAYEHRLEAEKKMGRQLEPGEIVHHIDGDKQNNAHENLSVEPSIAHHRAQHRTRDDLRLPDEPNPEVTCECGCGERFPKFDGSGRPRRYVTGHNPIAAPSRDALLEALRDGPAHRADLARRVGSNPGAVGSALTKMRRAGLVEPLGAGRWRAA